MKKIESFQVDHIKLNKGVYVSRIDYMSDQSYALTTYDIRMKLPNREPVLNTGEIHTIEHLGATFLRNHDIYNQNTIYFGPMGCRTGFYLILKGEKTSLEVLPIISEMFDYIASFEGEIPGADPVSCGNYSDMNLEVAKREALEYKKNVLDHMKDENFTYP